MGVHEGGCLIEEFARRSLFGCMRGTVTVFGDIVAPLEEQWEADL